MKRLGLVAAIATSIGYLYLLVTVGEFLLNDRPRSRMGGALVLWALTIPIYGGGLFWSVKSRGKDEAILFVIGGAVIGILTCVLVAGSVSAFG